MKLWLPLLTMILVAGCSMLPEQGPQMKELSGFLTFRETTALPETATVHMIVSAANATADAKPIAIADFPAKTGDSIPFTVKIPASKVAAGGEYIVLAQVLDHGKIWYSNLSSPERISFLAEPGELSIELRSEKL